MVNAFIRPNYNLLLQLYFLGMIFIFFLGPTHTNPFNNFFCNRFAESSMTVFPILTHSYSQISSPFRCLMVYFLLLNGYSMLMHHMGTNWKECTKHKVETITSSCGNWKRGWNLLLAILMIAHFTNNQTCGCGFISSLLTTMSYELWPQSIKLKYIFACCTSYFLSKMPNGFCWVQYLNKVEYFFTYWFFK